MTPHAKAAKHPAVETLRPYLEGVAKKLADDLWGPGGPRWGTTLPASFVNPPWITELAKARSRRAPVKASSNHSLEPSTSRTETADGRGRDENGVKSSRRC